MKKKFGEMKVKEKFFVLCHSFGMPFYDIWQKHSHQSAALLFNEYYSGHFASFRPDEEFKIVEE